MKGAMILMLLLLYPVLVTARVPTTTSTTTTTTTTTTRRPRNERLYVAVETGTQAHADTDDLVRLQLFGAERNSPALVLDGPGDDFQRGAVNHFNLETPHVSDISYIKLKIGGDDGWFVKEIAVSWMSIDAIPLAFFCNSWIDDSRFQFAYPRYLNTASWRVTVKTGDLRNSHTGEIVMIAFSNGTRQTPPYILDKKGYDDFERNSEDVYNLTTEYIGELRSIQVIVGEGHSWFLSWVNVESVETRGRYNFSCSQWFHHGRSGIGNATCEYVFRGYLLYSLGQDISDQLTGCCPFGDPYFRYAVCSLLVLWLVNVDSVS